MYLKYIVNKTKTAPAKLWNDWRKYRNFPGMEYFDIHGDVPGIFKQERFPSPANYKFNPEHEIWKFKWDYKTPFRDSPYFIRRHKPEVVGYPVIETNVKLTEKQIQDQLELTPIFKDYITNHVEYQDTKNYSIEKFKEEARIFIESSVELLPYSDRLISYDPSSGKGKEDLVQRYYPVVDCYGTEKGTDLTDAYPMYMQFYFDGVTTLQNFQKQIDEENGGFLDMYVGRTKKWQTIPDIYGKDQVDKIQVAIQAPVQEQLDEWDRENEGKKLPSPVNNENVHKFRGNFYHYENLDHDYERIIYERNKHQHLEMQRNSRYWQLNVEHGLDSHSHSHH